MPDPPLPPGSLVELRFRLDQVTAHGLPLLDDIDTFAIDYLGRQGDVIAVYGVITAAVEEAEVLPVREFVSIRTVIVGGRTLFQAWFHTEQPVGLLGPIQVRRGFGSSASQ